jgi:polyphosphate kinase 2
MEYVFFYNIHAMNPLNINDIFNNLIILNPKILDDFYENLSDTYKTLRKEKDVDNLKVLRNKLATTLDSEHNKLSQKESKDLRNIRELLEDMSETIEEIEGENQEKVVLVDVIKKQNKKYTPLQELPEDKKNTHILVSKRKSEIAYEDEMLMLQLELVKLQRYVQDSGEKVLIIFEWRDAAGKGGSIKRFMENLNPRYAKVVALMKPTEVEKTQWYFERYLRHLPNGGEIIFFDRSWYNRAWVEPVMGFVNEKDYKQFMDDVPLVEKMLVKSWIKIIKFYFSVSKEEQAQRFKDRLTNPLKQYKLSPIDQFSQKLWDKYTLAEYENFSHTDTDYAPWTIINSDDKEAARINAIKFLLSQFNYKDKISSKKIKIDNDIVQTGKQKIRALEDELDKGQSLFS